MGSGRCELWGLSHVHGRASGWPCCGPCPHSQASCRQAGQLPRGWEGASVLQLARAGVSQPYSVQVQGSAWEGAALRGSKCLAQGCPSPGWVAVGALGREGGSFLSMGPSPLLAPQPSPSQRPVKTLALAPTPQGVPSSSDTPYLALGGAASRAGTPRQQQQPWTAGPGSPNSIPTEAGPCGSRDAWTRPLAGAPAASLGWGLWTVMLPPPGRQDGRSCPLRLPGPPCPHFLKWGQCASLAPCTSTR